MDEADLEVKYDLENSFFHFSDEKFFVYAHENELFHEHISKTFFIFCSLVDEKILLNFHDIFIQNKFTDLSFDEFKEMIFNCIKYHDIGKLSFNFQINKLNRNNARIYNDQKEFLKKIGYSDYVDYFVKNHSLVGSLVFLTNFYNFFNNNELLFLILSYIINGHHTRINDILPQEGFTNIKNYEYYLFTSNFLLDSLSVENCNLDFKEIQHRYAIILKDIPNIESSLSFFYMYIYSLLIVADVFASDKYNESLEDVKKINFNNRISEDLLSKMNSSYFSKNYNKNLSSDYESIDLSFVKDINILRRQMLLESSYNLIQSINERKVFFLHMPTGGGKTNTSMKLALDILNNNKSINRVIYAMPFINIIEQNYDVICDSLGLSEDNYEIRKIYSGSETLFEDSDELKYEVLLNDDFYNYPVICTTFVSLFNSIIENKKKSKYKLSSLVNSVIILDEIQSLPLKNWNSLYYIINEMASKYNIYFIIMSATLPDFNRLKLDTEYNLTYYNESLISDPSKYFNHKLFNRTEIKESIKNFELTEDSYEEFIDYLCAIIKKNFDQGYFKGLMVFNTIKSSKLVFDKLNDKLESNPQDIYFDMDLLNSGLIPATKNEIISKINHLDDDEKYILISTQSVEAGVDVSFDFVVRDYATIDSIEQVRGRCNRSRELNKRFNDSEKKGNIYLTKLNNKKKNFFEYIYNDEEKVTRIKSTDHLLENSLNYTFHDIEKYYSNISLLINENNDEQEKVYHFIDRNNIEYFNKCQYSSLLDEEEGIHIIDNHQKQFSLFVEMDAPIISKSFESKYSDKNIFDYLEDEEFITFYNENKKHFIFSINELKFIKKIQYNQKIYDDNHIIGKHLLNYYMELVDEMDNNNFNQYKLLQKQFSSLFYKFIINVSLNSYEELYSKIETELEKFGFFYILSEDFIGDEEDSFYSLKRGFNFHPRITEIL